MIKLLITLLGFSALLACGGGSSEDAVTPAKRLFNSYPAVQLPFSIADSNIANPTYRDTANLSLFMKLVPDTVFRSVFKSDRKLKLYAIGKIEQDKKESYLISLAKSNNRAAVFLTVFDKDTFKINLPLLVNDQDNIRNFASVDKKLSVSINKEWTDNNSFFYSRIIYAYNNVGVFTTVLKETNVDPSTEKGIVNPLDTFPKKYKYSADYSMGKNAILNIRDGALPNTYRFYIYFTTEDGEEACKGELNGEFKMTSEKEGTFSESGDPCTLNFSFKGNTVVVKETGTCGNYRGIKCFFNHNFQKKRDPKPVIKKK